MTFYNPQYNIKKWKKQEKNLKIFKRIKTVCCEIIKVYQKKLRRVNKMDKNSNYSNTENNNSNKNANNNANKNANNNSNKNANNNSNNNSNKNNY